MKHDKRRAHFGRTRDGARWCASDFLAWDLITPDQRDILTAPIRAALPDLWADVSAHLPD